MISVLLTTENSDDLEIQVPDGSRSLKVTPVNSSCVISYKSLIVPEAVSCTLVRYSLRQVKNRSTLLPLLRLMPPVEGFPWYDLH